MTQNPSDLLPFYDEIHRYAYRVTGSYHDADDVTQDVYFKYLKSGKSYQGDQLRNYLYKTARNCMIDQHRRKKLHVKLAFDENSKASLVYRSLHIPPKTPEQNALEAELHEVICQIVNRLPPRKQEIYHLRHDEKMKAKDIAEVLGLSYDYVRQLVSEIDKFVTKELESYFN